MCNLLDSISCKFDFIFCSETWFTSETDYTLFQIPGYTLLNENRTFSTGGGVALYVTSGYFFSISVYYSLIYPYLTYACTL